MMRHVGSSGTCLSVVGSSNDECPTQVSCEGATAALGASVPGSCSSDAWVECRNLHNHLEVVDCQYREGARLRHNLIPGLRPLAFS